MLEAEAVHIIREVVAELEKPVLLFSAGKDSIVLLRLAEKAFRPSPLPFPVLHIDTGHNFGEVIDFRDRRVTGNGHTLIVGSVQESIDSGRVAGSRPRRHREIVSRPAHCWMPWKPVGSTPHSAEPAATRNVPGRRNAS